MRDLPVAAQQDRARLIRAFGEERVQGPEPEDERPGADWRVTLVRDDGRELWCYGESPEAALARAREWVDGGAGFTAEAL